MYKDISYIISLYRSVTANGNVVTGTPYPNDARNFVSSQSAAVLPYIGTKTFGSVAGGFNIKLVTGIQTCYLGSAITCYLGSAIADGPQLTYKVSVGAAAGGSVIVSADYAIKSRKIFFFDIIYFT